MKQTGIDQEALTRLFSESTAQQGEALRQAVGEATLKALQGRELTLQNIRSALQGVTEAASAGAARNPAPAPDMQAMLGQALGGMDAALLQAVEAHRQALAQFVDQGADLHSKLMQGVVANLEKMEEMFFSTVTNTTQASGGGLQAPWAQALGAFKQQGSHSGAQATEVLSQLMSQAPTPLRGSQQLGLGVQTSQALMAGYATLVSGVLMGLSEGLQKAPSAGAATGPAATPAAGTRPPPRSGSR